MGIKGVQILHLFADPDVADGYLKGALHADHDAAPGGAVQLG